MNTLSRKGWRKRTPHLVPIDTKEISSLTPCLRLYIHAISSQNQISSNYNTTNRIHSLMLKRCFLQTLLVWARGRKRWHHVNRTEETNWSACRKLEDLVRTSSAFTSLTICSAPAAFSNSILSSSGFFTVSYTVTAFHGIFSFVKMDPSVSVFSDPHGYKSGRLMGWRCWDSVRKTRWKDIIFRTERVSL